MFRSKKVITHNGEFHADDACAVAALSLLLGRIKIIRTRDESVISTGDFVVDVGGVYDPAKNRFDHHQVGGAGMRENGIPYAAFGLVWKTYGEKIAGSKEAAAIIDKKLVSPVDALDNGVSITKEIFTDIRPYGMSSIIGSFNPRWNEGGADLDARFADAVALAKKILTREIGAAQAAVQSESIVLDIYNKTQDKRLIILEQDCDWEHVLQNMPEPLYVVVRKEEGWRVKAVRKNSDSFDNRKDLPKAWAGKRGAELAAVTGVADAIFCHNKLFIASARSREGALKLATIALEA